MDIPWKLSGEAADPPVNRSKGLNKLKPPTSTFLEQLMHLMLLPIVTALFLVRMVFRYDTAKYFSTYEKQ